MWLTSSHAPRAKMPLRHLGLWLMASWLAVVATASAAGREAPLLEAVRSADHSALRALIQQHADPNAATPDGTTALHIAVERDDLEATDVLLRAGASPGAANRYGITALYVACPYAILPFVSMLLTSGADAGSGNSGSETGL